MAIPLGALDYQIAFIQAPERHPALVGGRGSGKTISSALKGGIYAGNYPGSLGVLTSPTYVQVRDNLVPAFRQMFGDAEGKVWEFRRADMEIRFNNGSVILLRPANEPDRLRGLTLGWFGMDEIAIGDQYESFIILQACLRQRCGCEETHKKGCVGYPLVGYATTTPHWRRPWIRKMWKEKRNPITGAKLSDDYKLYPALTMNNSFLREGFVEELRQSAPSERYARQELLGEFIDVEGVAFPQFSESTHVRMPPETMKVKKRVMGVDFGAVRPTAVIEMCLLEDGTIQGTYEFYQRSCSEKQLIEAIAGRPRTKVLCDPSGKELIEMLRRYGINASAARSNNFGLRYRLLASRLNLVNRATGRVFQPGETGSENAKPGMYFSPNQPNLINEIQNLAFASSRGEMLKDAWEQGLDDHAADAAAYCLMELDPSSFKVPQIQFHRKIA